MSDQRGIYHKFDIRRTDGDPKGKHDKCFCFVLDLEHDPFAWPALHAYALACAEEHPQLSADLFRELRAHKRGDGDLRVALERLVLQVRRSNAVDDHGHPIIKLRALAEAEVLLGLGCKPEADEVEGTVEET